jgi:hypothetical protein
MTLPHRALRAAALTAALGALSALVGAPASASVPFNGAARVGALFPGGLDSTRHSCTGAVVDSPQHNLLVTAAHCHPSVGEAFVPGFHDGVRPWGTWVITRVYTLRHADANHDVAFAETRPAAAPGPLESVVGSEAIRFDPPRRAHATAVGYPNATDRPVRCDAILFSVGTHQARFDCPGLPGGTSGGPYLTGTDGTGLGRGTVIGVIGGYEEGGDSPDVSYSPYLDHTIAALYREATR